MGSGAKQRRAGSKGRELTDSEAALLIAQAIAGEPSDAAAVGSLSGRWLELYSIAKGGGDTQAGRQSRVDGWIAAEGESGAAFGKLIDAALAEPITVPFPDMTEPEKPAGYTLGEIDAADFAVAEYPREWLVEGVSVVGQTTIVGGGKKCLKTSVMVDYAVSVALGLPFLGKFEVPTVRRCLFITGESGPATLQETLLRVCKAKDVEPAELRNRLYFAFNLPKLSDPEDLEVVADFIKRQDIHGRGIEVAIFDPLYLCLLSGSKLDAANLFDTGPLLKRVADIVLEAGATPVLVHHLRKGRSEPFAVPELEDLAFAGVQEFARQWVMLGRRSVYKAGSGRHELWLAYGGSSGHSGEHALDITEGVVDRDFGGRGWDLAIRDAEDAKAEVVGQEAEAKAVKREVTVKAGDKAKLVAQHSLADQALAWFLKNGPATQGGLRAGTGWSGTRTSPIVALLLLQGRIRPAKFDGPSRHGTKEFDGYEAVPGAATVIAPPESASQSSDDYTRRAP